MCQKMYAKGTCRCVIIHNEFDSGELIMIRKEQLRLYAITDTSWLNGASLIDVVENVLKKFFVRFVVALNVLSNENISIVLFSMPQLNIPNPPQGLQHPPITGKDGIKLKDGNPHTGN